MLVVVLATVGFLLPQKIPLEYYPLNNPSSGLNYLEITCAANVQGDTDFYLDTGRGFNELEKIRLPIGPSQSAYTYTFPLPDAPLIGLRLDPFISGPGEFTISRFRIINRSGDEIHRFTKDDFQRSHQIEAIFPVANGWRLAITGKAEDPYSQIKLLRPIVPRGMNGRNFERCLLSWSYLALMLWILLLAVYFALRWPGDARVATKAGAFLAVIALLFSLVGNRGLIKNFLRCAHYAPAGIVRKP